MPKRSYPLHTPSHLAAALKVAASHATPALRKSVRDALARRYPGVKAGQPPTKDRP